MPDKPSHHAGTRAIETERLTLRRFKVSDAPYVFHNWAKDPENVMHLTWKAHPSVELTESLLTSWVDDYSKSTNYRWCITLKGTDIPIGGIDVTKIIDDRTCEIGFVLSKAYWNKGIMTEAAKAVIEYLFAETDFETVTAYHSIDNPASGKVLKKIGMKRVRIVTGGAKKNTGEPIDSVIYTINKR
jgi:ribosomal-protein-alanine N-acetyltransferase